MREAIGRADANLNAGRPTARDDPQIWNTLASGKEATLKQRDRCRLPASYTADRARQVTDLAYHHGGSTSFKRSTVASPIAGVTCQTVTLAPEWCSIGGHVYLGLDPGPCLR